MEDDESGGSSLNSSDGGSGSWSNFYSSLNKNASQQVPSREGAYGRMESQQLLSNDFYTRQFSRARPEQSDEDFDEETDEEGVEQQQGHNAGEDGSESDYDGVNEETQLLQQYIAAHYSKVDHEEKIRCRATFNLPLAGDNNRHRLGETTPAFAETQLLESRLPAIPSASEASEGSPFQICVGTVHAESIRVAAMQPITWHPKLKLDDHSSRSLPLKSTVCRPDLPSSEPEWMRDYGLKSPFGISYTPGSPYNGTTTRTLGSESRFSQMKTAVPPRSSLGPRLPSPIQHNTNILSSAVEFRNAIPVLVDETSGKTAVEASTAISSSSESVKTAVPPLRDEFKVSMSPMPTFPLEIERLRGMPCSSPCTPSPYLIAEDLEVREDSATVHESESKPETFFQIAEDLEVREDSATVHESSAEVILENEDLCHLVEERSFSAEPNQGHGLGKKRMLSKWENRIVQDAVKRFSRANPRKWVDECRDELNNMYNIPIGSSALTTRKFRDL